MADNVANSDVDGHVFSSGDGPNEHQDGESGPSQSQTPESENGETAKNSPSGGFDPTPLPDAPQGYTLRFTFQRAENLPPSDFDTGSSDPYVIATLKGNLKRHKSDPDLTHRTRTIRKTTEPVWQDQWIVANVPPTGFTLECSMYDEDTTDSDDCLGLVTVNVSEDIGAWKGISPPGKDFNSKKSVISKRAFLIKGLESIFKSDSHMTPRLRLSIEVLGKSDPPHGQTCTIGPTGWIKHFSPMIGRIARTKVNTDEEDDRRESSMDHDQVKKEKKSQKYDFQANEMQLSGPVPSKMYHRYVEFRPVIGYMFASAGLRGKILNKALHKQHNRVYNFDKSTEYGNFEACTKDAALHFLKLVHFDQGGRIFTYVLTLDGLLRFTETGKEFGIDLLSKHTMHSNVERYIACSGEFFVRRLEYADASEDPEPKEKTHPEEQIPGGPPNEPPPLDVSHYQLVIDNDSGTYRPDKRVLPDLKEFLHKNFPGLGVVTMHWEDEELGKLKEAQRQVKKKEGTMVNVVLNRSHSGVSSAESELADRDETWHDGNKSKREAAYAAVENPSKLKEAVKTLMPDGVRKDEGKE